MDLDPGIIQLLLEKRSYGDDDTLNSMFDMMIRMDKKVSLVALMLRYGAKIQNRQVHVASTNKSQNGKDCALVLTKALMMIPICLINFQRPDSPRRTKLPSDILRLVMKSLFPDHADPYSLFE